jgi:hypothetical protein
MTPIGSCSEKPESFVELGLDLHYFQFKHNHSRGFIPPSSVQQCLVQGTAIFFPDCLGRNPSDAQIASAIDLIVSHVSRLTWSTQWEETNHALVKKSILLQHLDALLILHSFAYHLLKAVSSLY